MSGRTRFRVTALLGAAAVLVSLGISGMAEGGTRGSALERSLEKQGFSEGDRGQIARAVRSAVSAGIPEREATSLAEDCAKGRFEAPQVIRMLSVATQLSLGGLPLESFTAKVEEGLAKRVAPDRIVQVAERRALMLNQAKRILDGLLLDGAQVRDREELIPDVAAALEGGRSAGEIQRILTAAFEEGARIGEIRRKFFP